MNNAPLVTLAVIARDEAATLARLLDDHRGLWDDAVVVDTGSQDDTAAVAQAHGARVASFTWCDDFSAARNAALALCRGSWVLILDADEHVAMPDQAALRALATSAQPCGFLLPQWNYADEPGLPGWRPVAAGLAAEARGAPGYVVAHQVRLFPAGSGVRYAGRVHENVETSLRELGWPLVQASTPVHHHGHVADAATRAARRRRYGRLLRLKLQEHPADPRTRCEMAVQLLEEGQAPLARRLLEHVLADTPAGAQAAAAHRLLGRLAAAEGRLDAAAASLRAAVTARPDLADLWPDLIRILCRTGDIRGAAAALGQLERLFPDDPRVPALRTQVQAGSADNV